MQLLFLAKVLAFRLPELKYSIIEQLDNTHKFYYTQNSQLASISGKNQEN